MTLMPLFQTMLRHLTYDAINVSNYMDCLSHKLLTQAIGIESELSFKGHCNMSILTMGNKNVHGFGCSLHTDKDDCYSSEMSEVGLNNISLLVKKSLVKNLCWSKRFEMREVKKRQQYALETVQTLKLGVRTTCGYQICIKDGSEITEEDVWAYFFSADLGAVVRIRSNYFHSFHAYAFNHQTVVPVVKHNGLVYYKHPDLDIVGWGAGKKKNRS